MIAKALRGWKPAGLIAYLMGPGAHEEHRSPRIVASWDGAPSLLQPPKAGPGEFDFDLHDLVGAMSALPKEFGLPLDTPPLTPDGFLRAEEWTRWLRVAGKRRPPELAPDWVRFYRYDAKLDRLVLKAGYVWHCPVRLHPDDAVLSDERWRYVAQRLMEATGIHQAGARWIAVRHADDHIHLMATLVADDGGTLRRVYPRNDYLTLRRACRGLEHELGLRRTPDIDWTVRRHPTRNEVGKAERVGRIEPARVELQRLVSQAAATASNPEQFFDRLDEFGVLHQVTRFADGRPRGCRFALEGDRAAGGKPVWFGGGRLASDLTWPTLQARWAGVPEVKSLDHTGDGRSTPASRLQALEEATAVVTEATARMRSGTEQSPAAVAHAAGELLGSLALGTEYRGMGPVTTALDYYDRAMRAPGRVLGGTSGGLARELRWASRRLALAGSISGRGSERLVLAALLLALTALLIEICSWQVGVARDHQAAAARQAAAALPVDRSAAAARLAAPITVRPPARNVTTPPRRPPTRPGVAGPQRRAGPGPGR